MTFSDGRKRRWGAPESGVPHRVVRGRSGRRVAFPHAVLKRGAETP